MKNRSWNNRLIICLSTFMLPLMIFMFLAFSSKVSMAEPDAWQNLGEGLYLGEFDPRIKSKICDRKIVILKADPSSYSLKLLSASEHGRRPRTAKQWSKAFGLLAAINASMYQDLDQLKSTGYMKNYKHLNNAHINPTFGAFILFNPVDPSLPEVQIVDRRIQKNWKDLIKKYNSAVQNYRMISSGKRRGWPQREEIYGTAAIATDRENHVLFILSPAPYSTHDFIHILISLPIKVNNAIYVEGGPEATLYLKIGGRERTLIGACETDLNEQDDKEFMRTIPNVIGIVKRRENLD